MTRKRANSAATSWRWRLADATSRVGSSHGPANDPGAINVATGTWSQAKATAVHPKLGDPRDLQPLRTAHGTNNCGRENVTYKQSVTASSSRTGSRPANSSSATSASRPNAIDPALAADNLRCASVHGRPALRAHPDPVGQYCFHVWITNRTTFTGPQSRRVRPDMGSGSPCRSNPPAVRGHGHRKTLASQIPLREFSGNTAHSNFLASCATAVLARRHFQVAALDNAYADPAARAVEASATSRELYRYKNVTAPSGAVAIITCLPSEDVRQRIGFTQRQEVRARHYSVAGRRLAVRRRERQYRKSRTPERSPTAAPCPTGKRISDPRVRGSTITATVLNTTFVKSPTMRRRRRRAPSPAVPTSAEHRKRRSRRHLRQSQTVHFPPLNARSSDLEAARPKECDFRDRDGSVGGNPWCLYRDRQRIASTRKSAVMRAERGHCKATWAREASATISIPRVRYRPGTNHRLQRHGKRFEYTGRQKPRCRGPGVDGEGKFH